MSKLLVATFFTLAFLWLSVCIAEMAGVMTPTPTPMYPNVEIGPAFQLSSCGKLQFINGKGQITIGERGEIDREMLKTLPPKAQELVRAVAEMWGGLCEMGEDRHD